MGVLCHVAWDIEREELFGWFLSEKESNFSGLGGGFLCGVKCCC